MSGASETVYATPLFGVAVTVIAYAISSAVHHRFRWMPTLVLTCGGLIALLLVCHIPYASYKSGGDIVSFFLGPATIALGVPFYKHAKSIRAHGIAVVTAVAAGSATGILSAGAIVLAMHGSPILLRSMLPKSVTTPISIELSRQLGGVPELTAVFTVLAGLLGSVIGPQLLRLCRIRGNIAIGLAMGTSSHGIGTARILRDSEFQGGASGLAMALAGIITSLMIIPLQWWLR
jgi:predicted murein hydrolase (TIGR00659 family)